MASDLSTATADAALEAVLNHTTTYYLTLFTSDPGTTGAAGEWSGGRQAFTPNAAASAQQTFPSAALSFTGVPAGTYTHFGIFTAATAGSYVGGGALTASISPPAGSTVTVAAGAFTATI